MVHLIFQKIMFLFFLIRYILSIIICNSNIIYLQPVKLRCAFIIWFWALQTSKVTKLVLVMNHSLAHLNIKYTTISFPKSIWTWNFGIHVEATYYLLTTNHYKICCHNFVFRVPRERKNSFIAFCIFYTLSW